jgi:hypothetical protein
MYATHCAADEGRFVSVPKAPTTCNKLVTPRHQEPPLSYVFLHVGAYIFWSRQPSLLTQLFDVWIFGRELVLQLKTCGHPRDRTVAPMSQDIRQGFDEF